MTVVLASWFIEELFEVRSGDFHATKDLDPGLVPLISCGDENNGLVGYFDIPNDKTYANALTVAYNGSWPLTSKFHPYRFGAKDDVAVLVPRSPQPREVLIFVAAFLNRMTWRYSYGRKCFRQKLLGIEIALPTVEGDVRTLDVDAIRRWYEAAHTNVANAMRHQLMAWDSVAITPGELQPTA